EDAFQATFLVLARKAGSLRDREHLGPWLYGVARRVAMRAREVAARRRSREWPGAEEVAVETIRYRDPDELRSVLEEELGRLPAAHRAAVVLCYLEGLTNEEAARQLGWPVGTVKSRLSWARGRLKARLILRGLAPSAGLLAATLTPEATSAPMPA